MSPTCNVPQLEPDGLVVPVEHLQGEVHSDRGSVVVGVGLMDVASDDGGLPDAEVSDHQHLVQVLGPQALHAVGLGRVVGHVSGSNLGLCGDASSWCPCPPLCARL